MDFSKFDQLIYTTKQSDLTQKQIITVAKELFPNFDPETDNFNDQFLTDFNLEKYAYHRSLGLSLVEVAHSIGWSATLLSKIYFGERLSLDRLIDFAEAETYSVAERKSEHLGLLEKEIGDKASVIFLEKAFSKEYGDRKQIDINAGFIEPEDENTWNIVITHVDNMPKTSKDKENFDTLLKDK